MSRFAEKTLETADGVAALAIARALIAYLNDHGYLTVEEVSEIQNAAIEDLSEMQDEVYEEARQVIRHAFP